MTGTVPRVAEATAQRGRGVEDGGIELDRRGDGVPLVVLGVRSARPHVSDGLHRETGHVTPILP